MGFFTKKSSANEVGRIMNNPVMFMQPSGPDGAMQYNGALHNNAVRLQEQAAQRDRADALRRQGMVDRIVSESHPVPVMLRDPSKPAEGTNVLRAPNASGKLWMGDALRKDQLDFKHHFVDLGLLSKGVVRMFETNSEIIGEWGLRKKTLSKKEFLKLGLEATYIDQANKDLSEWNEDLFERRIPLKFQLGYDKINEQMSYRAEFPTTQLQLNSWFEEYDNYKNQTGNWNRDLFKYKNLNLT